MQLYSSVSYFENGVYDNADIIAIWIGVTAVVILWLLVKRKEALKT